MQAWEEKNYEREEGRTELLKELINKKLAKGKSIEVIADELEEDADVVQTIMNEMK